MESTINIATWNLCLGLPNKKETVTDYLSANNVQICGLQETEIPVNFPEKSLNCGGYNIELEMNSVKKRVGFYIKSNINYVRRSDLEKENCHVTIIDIKSNVPFRLITLYRSFRPQGGISPEVFFAAQLALIKGALCKNCFIMGDFNLDVGMELRTDYLYRVPFSHLTDFITQNNLFQLVNFKTWTRTISGVKKESTLDHVYTDDVTLVNNVFSKIPTFGDHLLVILQLNLKIETNTASICKRNWNNYTPSAFINSIVLNQGVSCDVQSQWNALEHSLIVAADSVAPLIETKFGPRSKHQCVPPDIKRMSNRRKALLQNEKRNKDGHHLPEIKVLNKNIRKFYLEKRKSRVRCAANATKGNIWRAVGVAKDLNPDNIPSNLTLGGVKVNPIGVAGAFAEHFNEKIKLNVSKTRVDVGGVYNGKCKLIVQNRNFMTENDVKTCINELKNKKCEGFDRIPVCMLIDARVKLLPPLAVLFNEIYHSCKIPDQWKVAKIIPIFKKGSKVQVENYRPIANLCSASKVFEKLILKQIRTMCSKLLVIYYFSTPMTLLT